MNIDQEIAKIIHETRAHSVMTNQVRLTKELILRLVGDAWDAGFNSCMDHDSPGDDKEQFLKQYNSKP